MELWLLHVSTAAKYAHFDNTNVSQKLESKHEPFLADFKRGKTPQTFTFVEVPARSKSTLGVAFLALRGFPPFEVCKKGLVFAL
jgi:hypothetical protein